MDSLTKVKFSNLDKILYPDLSIKKSQVIEYYIKVAPLMLDYLKDRPLVTTRFPNGIKKDGFYEKDAPKGTPQWVDVYKKYSKTAKRNLNYIICNNLDTLIWLVNLAALEIHIPLSKTNSYENPDLILFDIDPEPPANINDAVEVASGLTAFKGTGDLDEAVGFPVGPFTAYPGVRATVKHNDNILLSDGK